MVTDVNGKGATSPWFEGNSTYSPCIDCRVVRQLQINTSQAAKLLMLQKMLRSGVRVDIAGACCRALCNSVHVIRVMLQKAGTDAASALQRAGN
jgi:hypothetical protein